MLRSLASSSRSTLGRPSTCSRCTSSLSTPTPPSPAPSASIRTFTSSPRRLRLPGPRKLLPEFTWRQEYKGNPKPLIDVYDDPAEADEALASLTSKRLSIDAEPGLLPSTSRNTLYTVGRTSRRAVHAYNTSHGIVSIADAEGVMVLYLAKMKHTPSMLKKIMEDDAIEKQTFGAPFLIQEFLMAADFFDNTKPRNIFDLRLLAEHAYPSVANLQGEPHNAFATALAKEMGLTYTVQDASSRNYNTNILNTLALDLLVKQCWFLHCVGGEIREKFFARLEKKVAASTLSKIPGIGGYVREVAEDTAKKNFRLDAEQLEPFLRERGELK